MTGFSLSFSLFFSLPLFVSRSVSRVAFPSLFSGKAGGLSNPPCPQKPRLCMSFFFPFRPAAKPGFFSFLSLSFFSLPLFVSRSVSRVAFPSLFSGKAGGPSIPTLGQQTSSFYLVLLSNMPPPKTVFSAIFFSLSLFFYFASRFVFSSFSVSKGSGKTGALCNHFHPPKTLSLYILFLPNVAPQKSERGRIKYMCPVARRSGGH